MDQVLEVDLKEPPSPDGASTMILAAANFVTRNSSKKLFIASDGNSTMILPSANFLIKS